MMTIIVAILVFGALVLIHELGHFLVAKAFNTRVYEFAIGMGPTIAKKKKGETTYSIHAIPVGGFVRFDAYPKPEYDTLEEEQADTKEYEESIDDERSLNNKNPWKRMLIMFAGSFMNVLLAVLLFIGLFTYVGEPTTTIGVVRENMPAYEAGMMQGDKVLSIDGVDINTWTDIEKGIINSKEEQINIEVENVNGSIVEYSIDKVIEDGSIKVGISPTYSHSLLYGTKAALSTTGSFVTLMIDTVGQLFTGKADMNSFAGPVGIISVVDQAVEVGFIYVINLTAMLSLNLAVLNLLPLPALDGGRIVITFAEILCGGRKLPKKVETAIHMAGAILLFSFMIFLTFKDVGRLIGG